MGRLAPLRLAGINRASQTVPAVGAVIPQAPSLRAGTIPAQIKRPLKFDKCGNTVYNSRCAVSGDCTQKIGHPEIMDRRAKLLSAYLRVSTDRQDYASQLQIINDWCARCGRTVEAVHEDTASGGMRWQDRGLSNMLETRSPGDTIIVSEVSRIARSTTGVLSFLECCANMGVTVIAARNSLVMDGGLSAKITTTILALAAEIERDLLRERTRAALAARRAAGLPLGRIAGSHGKRKLDGNGTEIMRLMKAGVALAAIARLLGVSRQTVYNFIKSDLPEGITVAEAIKKWEEG